MSEMVSGRILLAVTFLSSLSLGQSQTEGPLVIKLQESSKGQWVCGITNTADSAMTAVAFQTSSSRNPEGNLATYDAAIKQGTKLPPHQSTKLTFVSDKPEFRAAVFSDGASFGDASAVQEILKLRQARLQGLNIILNLLPESAYEAATSQEVGRQFQAAVTNRARKESDPQIKAALLNINQIVQKALKGTATIDSKADPTLVARYITTTLKEWRDSLAVEKPALAQAAH